MHALFFEMTPRPGHLEHYFDHVARLQPALARHEGLLFLDRYGARGRDDLLLSHQLWRSEDDIIAWRKDADHRRSQSAGYAKHFADYRIRVGERIDPAAPGAKGGHCVLAVYGMRAPDDPQFRVFDSFKREGQTVALADLDSPDRAAAVFEVVNGTAGVEEVALYAILRDYGQHDRAQAPQAFG
ncbi:antibiotic biosynthesis monooxygenase family protein [Thalassococcus sp. BH17M4-6]|uniref:antibiotic biosynthesis monooxygenase family protein n=1 Tax=Thalassococcus sp. BH17M4-6 TaxID=3413148 RepID=UPI003BD87B14